VYYMTCELKRTFGMLNMGSWLYITETFLWRIWVPGLIEHVNNEIVYTGMEAVIDRILLFCFGLSPGLQCIHSPLNEPVQLLLSLPQQLVWIPSLGYVDHL
jgi:hypothetical protein